MVDRIGPIRCLLTKEQPWKREVIQEQELEVMFSAMEELITAGCWPGKRHAGKPASCSINDGAINVHSFSLCVFFLNIWLVKNREGGDSA